MEKYKIDSDYILLILNCKKYEDKAMKQKTTWIKQIKGVKIKYFHVVGDKNLCGDKKYLVDDSNGFMYLPVDDDYNSLPSKIIHALDVVNERFNYKYIFKTDDDQRLADPEFFKRLISLIEERTWDKRKPHYGGLQINIKQCICDYYKTHPCLPKNILLESTIYCNGRFYLLSKEAVEFLLQKKEEIKKRYIEDHAIGFYLNSEFKNNMLNLPTHKIFFDF